jgi:chemotaxis protein methyltransferase CheR
MVREETAKDTLSPESLLALCELIYQDSGIVLDQSKRYLVETRLKPVVHSRGLSNLDQLCELVRLDQALRRQAVEAMTTNETYFFRDMAPFEALGQTVIPELMGRRAAVRRLSIWSAACSSGQEPYSLAILLKESVPELAQWKVRILGTDISEAMLERARCARYTQLEVNRGLPARYLVQHFQRDHLDWVLKPEIRAMVSFRPFNLKDPMFGLGCFDLVLCRNVLIYFDSQLKKRILAGIRGVLARDGYLLLGSAETVFSLDDHLERVGAGKVSFYRLK